MTILSPESFSDERRRDGIVNAKHSMMKRQYFTANSIFEKEFEMPNAMYDWMIG